ncbi:alpha/beta fold hydrolase [Streptomyces sp. NPDC094143]|uniref:alpha/beta fold hydrolase n=1 Tax=Streptomyces sp. NPDC094143 TaxID=3155310 RepID=UPI003330F90D
MSAPLPEPYALVVHTAPAAPSAAVVLLHGGRADALTAPPRLNLPALRMVPFARVLTRTVLPGQLLVASVRYRHRGWNGRRADAAHDARRALNELAALRPGLPVVLVGHSMGGRAALRVADHPQVRGIVGLAPWCPPDEPVAHLAGQHVILLHDPSDTVTHARQSWAFLRRAHAAGAITCGITMPSGRHAMVGGSGTWHRMTATAVRGILQPDTMPNSVKIAQSGTSCVVLSAHDANSGQ